MHGIYRATGSLHSARTTLAALAGVALVAQAYRLHRVSVLGITDIIISITASALLAAAICVGWAIHVRRVRARLQDEAWETVRRRHLNTLLDGDEDRALWDSVPAAGSDEDTCAIGINVVALDRYRYPQAG